MGSTTGRGASNGGPGGGPETPGGGIGTPFLEDAAALFGKKWASGGVFWGSIWCLWGIFAMGSIVLRNEQRLNPSGVQKGTRGKTTYTSDLTPWNPLIRSGGSMSADSSDVVVFTPEC